MSQNNFIPEVYRAIDAQDSAKLVSYMTEDAIFKFANVPAVEGKQVIEAFLTGFFQSIKAINHTELEYWNAPDVWFVTGNVNYTRHNNTILRVPFAVLLRMRSGLIAGFHIFVDNSELYQ